jgi:hypothetical protein
VTEPTLHPRLAELVELLAQARAEVLEVVATVTPAEAARSPRPDAWSVAQIVEHLRLVESGIVGALTRSIDAVGLDTLAPETETASVAGALDRFRLEERRSRLPAPARVVPGAAADLATATRGLEGSRKGLMDLVQRLSGRALGCVSFPHPAWGPLSCYEWLLFVSQHERRHAAQIREAVAALRVEGNTGGVGRAFPGVALALAAALAAGAPLSAQAPAPLPYESMARRIVAALQPARGERAILRSDGVAMPGACLETKPVARARSPFGALESRTRVTTPAREPVTTLASPLKAGY